jgi:hypothetical protein
MNPSTTIQELPRSTPVIAEADVCVLGGSCTGIFAAIRAARMGCRVIVVERGGCFGGVATLSLVNVWHSPLDEVFEKQIFAGLSIETMDRLRIRNAIIDRAKSDAWAWCFNAQELAIELDEMVRENKITPMLHTMFVAPHVQDGKLSAAIVENKSGRGAIKAKFFIDATGDGDLCHRAGLETYTAHHFQPSTTCAAISDFQVEGVDLMKIILQHAAEFGLREGFAWGAPIPGSNVYMLAGTRVYNANASEAAELTHSEIEGRRQVRAIMDLLRKYVPGWKGVLQALPARIGIRETRHVRCQYQLTGPDVLNGTRFDDAIANGSYRVDVHHQDKPGITFKYLNGKQIYARPGIGGEVTRWREETETSPTFYQIPFRSMLPGTFDNLLIAGRMIDADTEAHAAIRVMVNMNQTGEAAGTAAAMCLDQGVGVRALDVAALRAQLAKGGSIIL